MRHTVFVIGTRAQIVKIAPVLRLAVKSDLQHTVWFTGQHQKSVTDLIDDFALQSTFVQPENHEERSSIFRLLVWLPAMIIRCRRFVATTRRQSGARPLVVVHGDTLSTLLGAVAGRLGGGYVVHLESGLSSEKWNDPFPEELLRRMTFRLARYALCPNSEAAERMRAFAGCEVVDTRENTLLDCVRFAAEKDNVGQVQRGYYFVATLHRFQNIYDRKSLKNIVNEMLQAAEFGRLYFILHPPTLLRLRKYGYLDDLQQAINIDLRQRKPYTEFLELMSGARAVFSDGGSNQEELAYLGVPTVLYRERSERPDGLGANIVFRSSLPGSMSTLIKNGRIDGLRRESQLQSDAQPSRVVVASLAAWAKQVSE